LLLWPGLLDTYTFWRSIVRYFSKKWSSRNLVSLSMR
jgi:hypothetical protein